MLSHAPYIKPRPSGVSIFMLYNIIGPSVFTGVLIMLILIPINAAIATKQKRLQLKQMKLKDERIKMMNEVLNGIKVGEERRGEERRGEERRGEERRGEERRGEERRGEERVEDTSHSSLTQPSPLMLYIHH